MGDLGRPTKYIPGKTDEQVFKLALLGLTDKEMADVLLISEATFNNWKHQHPSFLESIQKGKEPADAEVAQSLYTRAKGYEYIETKEERTGEDEVKSRTQTTKHVPADTAAAFIWLKNRQSGKWRDKQITEVEHKGLEALIGNITETKGPPSER